MESGRLLWATITLLLALLGEAECVIEVVNSQAAPDSVVRGCVPMYLSPYRLLYVRDGART